MFLKNQYDKLKYIHSEISLFIANLFFTVALLKIWFVNYWFFVKVIIFRYISGRGTK